MRKWIFRLYGISVVLALVGTCVGLQLGSVPQDWVEFCRGTAVGLLMLSILVGHFAFCCQCIGGHWRFRAKRPKVQ